MQEIKSRGIININYLGIEKKKKKKNPRGQVDVFKPQSKPPETSGAPTYINLRLTAAFEPLAPLVPGSGSSATNWGTGNAIRSNSAEHLS
jgi:hypothetical protein